MQASSTRHGRSGHRPPPPLRRPPPVVGAGEGRPDAPPPREPATGEGEPQVRRHGRVPAGRRRRFPDGNGVVGHQIANGDVQEVEGNKGSLSTILIEGWLGVALAVVRGPTAASTAETEQGSAIPQPKGQRGSEGE